MSSSPILGFSAGGIATTTCRTALRLYVVSYWYNLVRRKMSFSVVCCIIGFDRNHSLQRTHRPTHAGANTNAPHKHARTHARTHARAHARTQARAHAGTRTHARTHARTHKNSQPGDRRMQGRRSAAVRVCTHAPCRSELRYCVCLLLVLPRPAQLLQRDLGPLFRSFNPLIRIICTFLWIIRALIRIIRTRIRTSLLYCCAQRSSFKQNSRSKYCSDITSTNLSEPRTPACVPIPSRVRACVRACA